MRERRKSTAHAAGAGAAVAAGDARVKVELRVKPVARNCEVENRAVANSAEVSSEVSSSAPLARVHASRPLVTKLAEARRPVAADPNRVDLLAVNLYAQSTVVAKCDTTSAPRGESRLRRRVTTIWRMRLPRTTTITSARLRGRRPRMPMWMMKFPSTTSKRGIPRTVAFPLGVMPLGQSLTRISPLGRAIPGAGRIAADGDVGDAAAAGVSRPQHWGHST